MDYSSLVKKIGVSAAQDFLSFTSKNAYMYKEIIKAIKENEKVKLEKLRAEIRAEVEAELRRSTRECA